MAVEGQVISCHTLGAWTEQIEKHKTTPKLMVIDFTASWCGPCRLMAPFLTEMAKKFPKVSFLKVDVDELKAVAEQWNVEAMPTFLFLKGGVKVGTVVGARKEELQQTITQHLDRA